MSLLEQWLKLMVEAVIISAARHHGPDPLRAGRIMEG